MPNESFKHDIFISYRREGASEGLAVNLTDLLRNEETNVFFDKDQAMPGDSIDDVINAALQSQHMVAILSNSGHSHYQHVEIRSFLNSKTQNQKLIVVLVDIDSARDAALVNSLQSELEEILAIKYDSSEPRGPHRVANEISTALGLKNLPGKPPGRQFPWKMVILPGILAGFLAVYFFVLPLRCSGQRLNDVLTMLDISESNKTKIETEIGRKSGSHEIDANYKLTIFASGCLGECDFAKVSVTRIQEGQAGGGLDIHSSTTNYIARFVKAKDSLITPCSVGHTRANSDDGTTFTITIPNGANYLFEASFFAEKITPQTRHHWFTNELSSYSRKGIRHHFIAIFPKRPAGNSLHSYSICESRKNRSIHASSFDGQSMEKGIDLEAGKVALSILEKFLDANLENHLKNNITIREEAAESFQAIKDLLQGNNFSQNLYKYESLTDAVKNDQIFIVEYERSE